jgi:hypothetical protein
LHKRLNDFLAAAPHLRLLDVSVACAPEEACRVLRNEPPFGCVRVRELGVDFPDDDGEVGEEPAPVLNLMEHVSMHSALRSLWLDFAPLHTSAAMRAVVDVALSSRLAALSLT